MGEIRDQFNYIYRDFVTDGVPPSGLNEVEKAEVRALGGVIEDQTALYASAASDSAEAALQAATAAQGAVHILSSSVSAGGALPFEVTALSGSFVGTGTGGTPGEYALTVSGGPAGHSAFITIGSDGKIASARIGARGIATANTAPTYALPSGTGLAGATLPTPTVSALASGRVFFAPDVTGTFKLGWQSSSGVVAAWMVGGLQYAEYFKAAIDAFATLYSSGNIVGEDQVAGFTLPLVINGNLAGGLERTGEWNVPAVKVKMQAVTGEDAGTGFKPLVSADGLTGVFLVGYNASNELDFKPSPQLIARFGVSGYLPVSTLRGTWGSEVFNVRRASTSHYIATVRDAEGRSFDARQRVTGAQSTLVIDDASNPMDMILLMGQSNAGEGGAGGVLFSTAAYPFGVFQLAGLTNGAAGGTTPISAAAYTDIIPAFDTAGAAGVRGQWPATMISFALQDFNAATGRRESGVIEGTSWEGSQPLASFFPFATSGKYNYENAVEILKAAKAAAALYGRTIRVTLVFIQGEAGPSGRTTYGNLLGIAGGNLLDTILPGLQTAAGMAAAPKVVLVQTNVPQGASENYACMGQYDVAQARADTVLACPMYQLPFYDTAHQTPLGRMMMGAPIAEAVAAVNDGIDWKPVQIASAVRSGVNIDLTYEGTVFDQGYALAADSDWVPTVANLGFAPYSTGGATLSSATITGKNTVRLTFGTAPAAGTVVAYATGANNANTGWAFRLGNLMVQTARRDPFHKRGFAVPERVRHYAIRQEITVS